MTKTRSNIAMKVFVVVSILGSLVMGILIYLAYKALQAPTDGAAAADKYNTLSNPVFYINLYLYLFNLGMAIWMKAKYSRNLYFLFGLFIFVFFVNVHLFWLSDQYFHFKEQYKMAHGEFSMSGIFALVLAVMAAVVSGIGYFIGGAIHRRFVKKHTDA